jgi:hypothetical protein
VIIELLNSFSGDDKQEIDTNTDDGRAQAAKLVGELIKSGSAVFLEREVNGQTYTYRVTGYDPATNKLTIRLDASAVADTAIEHAPRRASYGRISPDSGRTVAVAPRSGG